MRLPKYILTLLFCLLPYESHSVCTHSQRETTLIASLDLTEKHIVYWSTCQLLRSENPKPDSSEIAPLIIITGDENSIEITRLPTGVLRPNFFPQDVKILQIFLNGTSLQVVTPGAFNGCLNLRELYLQDNRLEEITEGIFNSLNELRVLHLERNDLKFIDVHSFMATSNLRILYLNDNKLTFLDSFLFESLPNLELLDLSNNPFKVIRNLTLKVSHINLSNTDLSHLTSLGPNTVLGSNNGNVSIELVTSRIKSMDLSHNKLTSLNLSSVPVGDLNYLNLSHNSLNEFKGSAPTSLEVLDLSSNNLTSISFAVLPTKLRYLNLSNNSISGLDASSELLLNLTVLDLHHNVLTSIPMALFQRMPSLQHLDLSRNEIKSLPFGVFDSLVQLTSLNLAGNHIGDVNFLYSFKQKIGLNLNNNKISNFFINHFPLSEISFDHNPWNCEYLTQLLFQLDALQIEVVKGSSYDQENVFGIGCEPSKSTGNQPETYADIIKIADSELKKSKFFSFFSTDFEKTAFFKFFHNVTTNDLKKTEESLERVLTQRTSLDKSFNDTIRALSQQVKDISEVLRNTSSADNKVGFVNNDRVPLYLIIVALYSITAILIVFMYFKISEKRFKYRVTKIENHDAAGLL